MKILLICSIPLRVLRPLLACTLWLAGAMALGLGAEEKAEAPWRALPLIVDGKVSDAWCHVGYGGFVVDDSALRTECSPKGLGLLVFKPEQFGDCQIRVVFRSKDAKSNAGLFVRIDDGILEQVDRPGAAFDRDTEGKISKPSMTNMMASAEREEGPWFAVHRGYEVQIMDANDPFHRTGAIYSFAASSAISDKPPGAWKTMIVTLAGHRILVELEGRRVTSFDPESPEVPRDRKWFEGKREPRRPDVGYLGLQDHDPGDAVWFRETSVRPLPNAIQKVLAGEVGELLVTARRQGATWYLGGLSAKRPRELVLPLSFLGHGRHTVRIWKDAADAEANPNHLAIETLSVSSDDTLKLRLALDGGFVARLAPAGN